MNRRELEHEGADLKLILLLLFKKISTVIIAALAGAAVFGVIYGTWHSRAFANRKYEATSKFYITFTDMADETFFAYTNAYTWNDLLSSDPIMGYAMDILAQGYTREYIDDCVDAKILSDLRVLTTVVKAKSYKEAELFQDAIEQALVHYGTVGENIQEIEVIRSQTPEAEMIKNRLLRASVTGAVLFAVCAILILLFQIVIDDGVYLPEEFEKRFDVPCAGIDCGFLKAELLRNQAHLCRGKESPEGEDISAEDTYPEVSVMQLCDASEVRKSEADFAGGEYHKDISESGDMNGGVIFTFPQGCGARQISRALHNLSIREYPVICAKITDADERMLKRYYGKIGGKKGKLGKEKLSK